MYVCNIYYRDATASLVVVLHILKSGGKSDESMYSQQIQTLNNKDERNHCRMEEEVTIATVCYLLIEANSNLPTTP